MRFLFLFLLIFLPSTRAADPFEIMEGDRVLLLGDTLLERENTYGYLETRMHEQFPDRHFTVRNLSWAGDTPRGVSRASFDGPDKGWERLKESIAMVRPTVVFLGYGMAASLQEMTDRAQDITLNRDETRYGAEPYSAARFKKEMGELMEVIASRAGAPPAEVRPGASPVRAGERAPAAAGEAPAGLPTGGAPALLPIRFVLVSPIRHEDLRVGKPGLPDPAPHNAMLEQYSKAIEELAKEKGARFVSGVTTQIILIKTPNNQLLAQTENGIHPNAFGYGMLTTRLGEELGWPSDSRSVDEIARQSEPLRAAVLKKNEFFFHRFRPENATYLFGFRKHEQGQNAKEIPMFDPLIAQAEAEIDRLKKAGVGRNDAAQADHVAASEKKLQMVIMPNLEFRDATVVEAFDFLKKKASDWEVNTMMLMPEGAQLPDAATRITVKLPNVSLLDAFKRVAELGKLNFMIDPKGAVVLTPTAAVATPPIKGPIDARTPPPLPDFTVQDGYQITLWAENPLLEKPTQMNWDAQGRLWVCSSSLYPQIEPGQPANDKILILEDTDRDGKADKSSVFADGLLIPTAVAPDFGEHRTSNVEHRTSKEEKTATAKSDTSTFDVRRSMFDVQNACYVGQSTELLRFEDTDGDGKADTKRVVFSGFGTEDTHHLIHTLRWGPDGRLYFNQSIYIHSHLETPWGMVRLNSAGVFAYDPRTERVEVLFKGLCNPWGHAWDQWGQSFMTDGAGGGGINWGVPGAMYFTYENGRRIMPSVSPGSYPKFCGLEIMHSPHFPDDWQGNAITNDFRAHRIVRFAIEDLSKESGVSGQESEKTPAANLTPDSRPLTPSTARSGYITKEMPDLVRTSDQSFRPIDVRIGPDGALYIADWSNPVINHGEVDFRDPRRDKHMGRIWRIAKKDAPPVKWEPLLGKTNAELLEKLLSKSAWEQQQARAVIVSRPSQAFADALNAFRVQSDLAETETLRLLESWKISPTAFADKVEARRVREKKDDIEIYVAPEVRMASARALSRWFGGSKQLGSSFAHFAALTKGSDLSDDELAKEIKQESDSNWRTLARHAVDTNPRVRLEAMRALCRIPTAESAALVLEAALKAPANDPYYDYAAWLSINDLAKPWTDAIASGAWQADTAERAKQLEWGLKAIDPALAGATLSRLVTENKVPLDGTGPWIELLGTAGGAKEIDRLWTRVQEKKTEETTTPRILAALTEAALLRNVRPSQPMDQLGYYLDCGHAPTIRTATRLAGAWKMESAVPRLVALTAGPDDATRNFAFEALRGIGSEPARAALRQLAIAPNAPPIRGQAVAALAALDLNPALTFDALAVQPAEDAALNVWRGVLGVKGAADKLAASIPKEMPKPVAIAGLRAAREAGKNGAKLLAALTPLAGMTDAEAKMPKDFKALAGFAKQNGDPARGEIIYRRAALGCTVCHAIGGAGGKVGPDMTSLGASAPLDYIIESTLAPAVKVKEGYNAVTLALKDGTQATGVQVRETGQEVFLRDVVGKEQAIAKAQITSTTNVGSIMPAGMTDALPDRERLDLFAFLGELGKPGPYDASKGTVARVWRLFSGADAAKVIGSETPMDTGFAGYTLVDGRFVKELLEATAPFVTNGAETLMAVTQFQSTGGKTRLKITGAGKAWLDGKPLALSDDLAPELSAGVHTLAVKLDMRTLPEYLRAESPDARFLGN